MNRSRRAFLLTSGALLTVANIRAAGGRTDGRENSPVSVKLIENAWIPLGDGCRLAARIWLPENAERVPVPVVFEYLPYRKRDLTREDDAAWASQFVPHGIAFVRVDIRGTGDSDGVLHDEYLPQEQQDAREVISWLSKQPWSSGAVGMRGYSWGGFNALQVAAKRPPALKAIVTQCASDNRYTDDSHYLGGAIVFDQLNWGAEFATVLTEPPDPQIVGPDWRHRWHLRLQAYQPVLARWLSHQRFDDFWRSGSVAADYAQIKCPTYVVDGQADPYRNFLPRLLEHLKVPRKGLFGAWGHGYPQNADPGPALDWASEEARWWEYWLAGKDNGIMREPLLQAYMEYASPSEVWPAKTPGRWIAEPSWPPPDVVSRTYYLNAAGLHPTPAEGANLKIRSNEMLGLTRREWFLTDLASDLPTDQTVDDRQSLTFNSEPLVADVEIFGMPKVTLTVSSNRPVAKIAARINEVTPDGKSWPVTYGVLNLTHRDGHEAPRELEVHRRYEVVVDCYMTAYRLRQGSALRVALSESLWPMVWPSPESVELEVAPGVSRLVLPVRSGEETPYVMPIAELPKETPASPNAARDAVTRHGPDATGLLTLRKSLNEPSTTLDTGVTITRGSESLWSIRKGDPNSSTWKAASTTTLKRGSWDTTVRGEVKLTSTVSEFIVHEVLHAMEGRQTVFSRRWEHRIKRDLM